MKKPFIQGSVQESFLIPAINCFYFAEKPFIQGSVQKSFLIPAFNYFDFAEKSSIDFTSQRVSSEVPQAQQAILMPKINYYNFNYYNFFGFKHFKCLPEDRCWEIVPNIDYSAEHAE